MESWRETTLGDVCDEVNGLIQTGPFGSQLHQSDYSGVGTPVVMPKDIVEGRIAPDTVARISTEHVERLSRHKLLNGDIVYGRRGDIGRQALITSEEAGWMCGTGCLRISLGDSVLWPQFLHYYLRQEDVVGWITNQAVGATMPNLNTGILRSVPVRFPPLPIQRRIASILSAYDELIENSQRRIKILESMARALYREWFVHFRFPGHESVPRVPSPLGEIPQGWEVRKLFELTKVNYGKNLPTKKLADDGAYPVYGAAKIIGRYTEYTREERTIICGCRGSVGEMQITQPRCYVTNNSFTFDPIQPDNYFWLFQTLKERGLRDVIGGAAQPQITLEGISSVELATPPFPLRTRFQQTLAPLFEQAWVLDSQTQNLRRTRDLLLPRLLSGQIDVEAMEA
jgi:type I restriction enzyme S subunit